MYFTYVCGNFNITFRMVWLLTQKTVDRWLLANLRLDSNHDIILWDWRVLTMNGSPTGKMRVFFNEN